MARWRPLSLTMSAIGGGHTHLNAHCRLQLIASYLAAGLISTPRPVRSAPRRLRYVPSCSCGRMSSFPPYHASAQTVEFTTNQNAGSDIVPLSSLR
ncbi:hypothetical protein EDB87DRAFT_1827201 [Lactarius vividus]|nr:hypothetical protein EDB87DRAFT_1827201 [Lactarius vividus]